MEIQQCDCKNCGAPLNTELTICKFCSSPINKIKYETIINSMRRPRPAKPYNKN